MSLIDIQPNPEQANKGSLMTMMNTVQRAASEQFRIVSNPFERLFANNTTNDGQAFLLMRHSPVISR
jgi:hypothetical protein